VTDREALLEHARGIAGDEGRWAEPYALLAGRVRDGDGLVKALAEANRPLALRALATAQRVKAATVREMLEVTADEDARVKVYPTIPTLIADPERAMELLLRLARETTRGHDLYWIREAIRGIQGDDAVRDLVARYAARVIDDAGIDVEGIDPDRRRKAREEVERSLREIPAGTFLMGSTAEEQDWAIEKAVKTGADRKDAERWYHAEGPRHRVTLEQPFQMTVVPVTWELFERFDPNHTGRTDFKQYGSCIPFDAQGGYPVYSVSWREATVFAEWVGCRLPREAEWEYACRAKTTTRFWSGDSEVGLAQAGWYFRNSGGHPHAVGEKPANSWQLHDMHGNVWEWCADGWEGDYAAHRDGRTIDPSVPPAAMAPGAWRIFRGGSFVFDPWYARSACRGRRGSWYRSDVLGFRLMRPSIPSGRPRS